jgi:hypothetical protein
MVLGSSGKYGSYNKFIMEAVPSSSLEAKSSFMLVDLSNKIIDIQSAYAEKSKLTVKQSKEAVVKITGALTLLSAYLFNFFYRVVFFLSIYIYFNRFKFFFLNFFFFYFFAEKF